MSLLQRSPRARGFQPFLRFYEVSLPRGRNWRVEFQPFLRFYMHFCASWPTPQPYHTFQPFLRFYMVYKYAPGDVLIVATLFQPFLRFYA